MEMMLRGYGLVNTQERRYMKTLAMTGMLQWKAMDQQPPPQAKKWQEKALPQF